MNLTLDEVSAKVGFSKPYLSTIETGKVKNPPSDQLIRKLEKVLEFEPGLLLHLAHLEAMPSDIRAESNETVITVFDFGSGRENDYVTFIEFWLH
ncbi:unnamed protein product [marine sediment metagenome]|uniref:HTH cro/C1-type domain-containing protein n=1 Tax=marine sediment metagenome TaxID=412755 RepID=X1RN91_9ZZZZ